jgi:hypothetical protein
VIELDILIKTTPVWLGNVTNENFISSPDSRILDFSRMHLGAVKTVMEIAEIAGMIQRRMIDK